MSKSSIKSLLQAIRALIMKSRPAYKDYLGNETVTTTTNIVSASLASVTQNFPIPSEYVDSSFTGLVAGETYTVSVNNVSNDYTATSVNDDLIFIGSDTYANIDSSTPPANYWFVTWTESTSTLAIGQAAGSYLSKSLTLSKTVTNIVDHWAIKKLPEECLPNGVQSKNIADIGGYFGTNPTVETALQQLGKKNPNIPTALKNPHAITIKLGSNQQSYDGSSPVTVNVTPTSIGAASTALHVTTLPANGTSLTANSIYNVSATVETYAFKAPTTGWAHGVFTTGTTPNITFTGKIIGKLPDFAASKQYEFDVYNGVWIVQEVVTQ